MSRITTRPATLTASQAATMLNGGKGVREVLVDGVVVGQYAKNKYGVTIGHFSSLAMKASVNPFVAAPLSHTVHPAGRTLGRTVKELIADIARQPVCEYERQIAASITAREEAGR